MHFESLTYDKTEGFMSEVEKVQVILLIIAVSVDVFVACVACGSEQIKIGSAALLCISTVCSGILGISLYAGMALQGVLLKNMHYT